MHYLNGEHKWGIMKKDLFLTPCGLQEGVYSIHLENLKHLRLNGLQLTTWSLKPKSTYSKHP